MLQIKTSLYFLQWERLIIYHKELNKYNDLAIDSGNRILISRSNLRETTNGVNIIVYDNITSEVVDYFDLPYTNDSISETIERDY